MMHGKIDPYLECISMRGQASPASSEDEEEDEETGTTTRCDELKPSVPVLDEQQISAIAVLERCKSNYQQKQVIAAYTHTYDNGQ